MAEPRTTFLVLINSRSGGQDGPQLLERFRTLAVDGLLTDGLQGEVPPPSHSTPTIPALPSNHSTSTPPPITSPR